MPRRLLSLLVILLWAGLNLPLSRAQSDPAWREDLATLAQELPQRHVEPFTQISQVDFDAAVAALDAEIPHLDDDQIVARLMQIVALLGDAHTSLAYNYTPDTLVFPLNFYPFADGLTLMTAPADYRAALGGRLVSIGNRDAADVMAALGTAIPHANEGWLRVMAAQSLPNAALLYGLGVIPGTDTASFTFELPGGDRVTLDIDSMPRSALAGQSWQTALDPAALPPAFGSHNPPNYWYEYFADSQTLYVNYAICAEAEGWPFADFMAEVLSVLDAQPVTRVAVDLRFNSGGDSRILEPLIDALAQRPAINQPGHLFVLIGPHTYSSALLNAIQFRQRTAALLVGEPTGGEPNHYGELQSFTLPHSGLQVFYSTKHFVYLEGDDSSALAPDRLIPLNAADLFAGRDPVLEAIFGWK